MKALVLGATGAVAVSYTHLFLIVKGRSLAYILANERPFIFRVIGQKVLLF